MDKIIFLGTGAGASINFYSTSFALKKDNEYMLVDGGGGNGILEKLDKANISFNAIRNIFVTHNHTDHIFGIIWVIRKIAIMMRDNKYEGFLDIYASDVTAEAIKIICALTLSKSYSKFIGDRIRFNIVQDREKRNILGEEFIFYDVKAKKEKQYGFRINLNNGKTLVCNGDETLEEANFDIAQDVDYLIHEAFCLDSEKEEKEPYKKGHSTSKDVCKLADKLNVKNLILYHILNEDLENRKKRYIDENTKYFKGNIFVPNDLEEIKI